MLQFEARAGCVHYRPIDACRSSRPPTTTVLNVYPSFRLAYRAVYTYRISQPDRLVHIEAHGEANLTGSQQILLTVMKDEHFLPEYRFSR